VTVLPISAELVLYAEKVHEELLAQGIRSELDIIDSAISYKIRQAETRKIPYVAICGKRETETGRTAVRKHGHGNLGLLTSGELSATIKNEETQ
jgi:threonyl-tRNA synthetase